MRKVIFWLSLLVFLSWGGYAFAVTTVPLTTYSGGGFSGYTTYQGLALRIVGGLQQDPAMQVCASVNPTTYALVSSSSSSMTYSRTCANGSTANFSVTFTASTNSCPAGQYLKNGFCTDSVDSGGGCKKGAEESFFVAGSSAVDMDYNGCRYTVVNAKNNCAKNGVPGVCGTWTTTGDAASSLPPPVTSSGLPASEDLSCATNKIVNNTTGTATCVDASASAPAVQTTQNTAPDGTVTKKETIVSDPNKPAVVKTTTTPTSGSPASSVGSLGGSGYVPNCVDSECTVKVDETGAPSVSSGNAAATSAITLLTDKTTAAIASQSSGDMSSFGIPHYTAPSDDSSKLVLPISGSDACENLASSFRVAGSDISYAIPVCNVWQPLKSILAWFLSVMVALYAWYRFARADAGEA